jgi:hypothetical protein
MQIEKECYLRVISGSVTTSPSMVICKEKMKPSFASK